MQSAVANLQPVAVQQSAGRKLLSRLTSGLAAKPRNFLDFHIKLEEEGRQYSTGDLVKGSVRLNVLKPTRITHIVVSLSGRAQVYKNPIVLGDHRSSSGLSTVGRGRNTGQYHGNGLATLFEDEIILCGDGRLVDGAYSFEFALEFPDRDLPTSVDFERGKIWYTITATITRPTTISPVTTYERDISFVERIDIAPLFPPKARNIILDPISKRSRGKSLKRIDTTDRRSLKPPEDRQEATTATSSVTTPVVESSIMGRSVSSQDGDRPRSPVPSELSIESHVSSSAGMPSHNGGGSMTALPSPTASFVSRPVAHGKNGMHAPRTISTTIESCSGGCLKGDVLSVKVNVHHVKYIKSMTGIIVTLYRHARIDTQPALSVGPLDGRGKSESKSAALQPSRTGLSGLSLTGAGSAHIFRKDLAQNFAPLVTNPLTFTTDVLVKLRVPEQDCFPTISCVPGAMMSFKYYIEVIVDIQGRLTSSSTMGPLRELTSTNMAPSSELFEVAGGATSMRPIDTSNIRRDKSVVCSLFELVIGTVDTERKGKKRAITNTDEQQQQQPQQQQTQLPSPRQQQQVGYQTSLPSPPVHPPAFETVQTMNDYGRPGLLGRQYSGTYLSYPEYAYQQRMSGYQDQTPLNPPPLLPVPQLPDESQLSEKERIQLAEARLLPSQPPGMSNNNNNHDYDENNVPDEIMGATAPQLIEDYDNANSEAHVVHCAGYHDSDEQFASASSTGRYADGGGLERYETAQRLYSNGHEESQDPAIPIGDQDSWMQGNGHFTAQGDIDHHAGSASTMLQYTTTAIAADGETAHDSHADASASAGLPRYER